MQPLLSRHEGGNGEWGGVQIVINLQLEWIRAATAVERYIFTFKCLAQFCVVHMSSLLWCAISFRVFQNSFFKGLLQSSRAMPSQQRKLQITNLSASQNHFLFVSYNFHTYKIKLSVKCLYSNSVSLSHLLAWHLQSCFDAYSVLFPSHILQPCFWLQKDLFFFFSPTQKKCCLYPWI